MREDLSELKRKPQDGIYIYGLYLDGGRWDRDRHCLADALPGVMYSVRELLVC